MLLWVGLAEKVCGDCHIFKAKLTWMQTMWVCELLSGLTLRAAGNLKWAYDDDDYFFSFSCVGECGIPTGHSYEKHGNIWAFQNIAPLL